MACEDTLIVISHSFVVINSAMFLDVIRYHKAQGTAPKLCEWPLFLAQSLCNI